METPLDVNEVLRQAKKIPTPPPYIPLHEFGEAIYLMTTEKNMSYREVAEWFAARGLVYSLPSFSNACAKWCALNPDKVKE